MESDAFVVTALDRANRGAIDQAVAITIAAFPGWKETADEAREEVRSLLAQDHTCLTAVDDVGEVFGWVGAIPQDAFAWELHPFTVRSDVRGREIGRTLVAVLEDRARPR